jgi:hypothetical protein
MKEETALDISEVLRDLPEPPLSTAHHHQFVVADMFIPDMSDDRGDGCCVVNIPAYWATRNNILHLAQASLEPG